ncbi:MAG: tetratricopeptide repeat protein [Candidatus Hatepunaea meridiana]|nr:tetratricopeptide repeat protein [Candidatus Hatepunaea meridiana]
MRKAGLVPTLQRGNEYSFLLIILSIAFLVTSLAFSREPGRDEYLYARKLLDEKYYDLAAEQLERILRDYPSMADATEAQYLLGETYLLSEKYERARAAFLRLAIVYPESPHAPEAMFKVGVTLEKNDRILDAAEAYARIHGFYSTDQYALKGLNKSITCYLMAGDTVRAETTMEKLLDKYPDSEFADGARLYKAKTLVKYGDREMGQRFLEWIADRSRTDSIAAEAYLELGRLHRSRSEFDAAEEAFRQPIAKYPLTQYAGLSAIGLADLYNYRGLTESALEIIEPILKSTDKSLSTLAHIKAGDACYRQKKYDSALSYYNKTASESEEGAFKAAWTYEISSNTNTALQKYLQISNSSSKFSHQAHRRAAIISGELGQWDKSAQLWFKVFKNSELTDTTGRTGYELIKARINAGEPIRSIVQLALNQTHSSFWQDEITYFSYIEILKSYQQDQSVKIPDPINYFTNLTASELLDSAMVLYDYYLRHYTRNSNLMEQMAELSSRPLGSVSPAEWALDWGNFYLLEFKDPVNAIDKYDTVIDDTSASAENIINAQRRSVQAYHNLYESALIEQDDYAIEMYHDSTQSRIDQLNRLTHNEPETITLTADFLRLNLVYAKDKPELLEATLEQIKSAINELGSSRFPVSVISAYVSSELSVGRLDSAGVINTIELVYTTISRTQDRRIKSQLMMTGILLNESLGQYNFTINAAKELVNEFPDTPAGAETIIWLMENPRLSPEERYKWLEHYKSEYPYLYNPGVYDRLTADLLDSLNKPIEALSARESAANAELWGIPKLDILDIPDETNLYYRGQAYMRASDLFNASEQFRILLNLNSESKHAASALLTLSTIYHRIGDDKSALSYLDTLNEKQSDSDENITGMCFRPVLLMAVEDYKNAYNKWNELIPATDNPDSILHYRIQSIICQYRLNNLEGARLSAKKLYKDFKDRDMDQYKAIFYLEKGNALDKVREFERAHELYELILKKYSFTRWADDAMYSTGWSLIQSGKIEEGAVELGKYIENYPDSNLVQDALLTMGLAYYRIEKYSEAVSALRKIWDNENAEGIWMQAYDALNRVYRDARFWDAAIRLTRDYIKRFPEASDKLDRKMDIGWFYLQLEQWDDAIRFYKPLLPIADAEREAEVQFYIGEANMNSGDYQTAILEYLKVRVLGRKTKLDWGVTALYKAGNCYEKLGNHKGAARMYKKIIAERGAASNYGMTAKKRLDALSEEK